MFGLRSISKCSFYSKVFVSSRPQSQFLKYFPRANISVNQNIQNVFARKSQCRYISHLENTLIKQDFTFPVPFQHKTLMEDENISCLSVLNSITIYKQYIPSLELCNILSVLPETHEEVSELYKENLSIQSGVELANIFLKYSNKPKYEYMLSNNCYEHLILGLSSSIKEIPNQLLIEVTKSLAMWRNCFTNTSFKSTISLMWDSALNEMLNRSIILKVKDKLELSFVPYFCDINNNRLNSYIINSLGSNIADLNSQEFVLYMFLLNIETRVPKTMNVEQFELKLLDVVDKLSIQEVGILTLSLFKTKTFIKDRILIYSIIQKTMANLEGIQDITLVSILKYLLKVVNHSYHDLISSFLDELSKVIPSLNYVTLTYIGLIARDRKVYKKKLLISIVERLQENLSEVRLEEIDRIMLTLSTFNFLPNDSDVFFEKVVKELERTHRKEVQIMDRKEVQMMDRKEPQITNEKSDFIDYAILGRIISSLTAFRVYSLPLTAQLLDVEFIKYILDLPNPSNNLNGLYFQLIRLNSIMELEQPDNYTGMNISVHNQRELIKKCGHRNLFNSSYTVPKIKIVETMLLKHFGSEKFIKAAYILPEDTESSLVFCTDSNGNLEPIPNSCFDAPQALLRLPDSNKEKSLSWNVICLVSRDDQEVLISMKIRQMKKLGYSVIDIPDNRIGKDILETTVNRLAQASTLNIDYLTY